MEKYDGQDQKTNLENALPDDSAKDFKTTQYFKCMKPKVPEFLMQIIGKRSEFSRSDLMKKCLDEMIRICPPSKHSYESAVRESIRIARNVAEAGGVKDCDTFYQNYFSAETFKGVNVRMDTQMYLSEFAERFGLLDISVSDFLRDMIGVMKIKLYN